MNRTPQTFNRRERVALAVTFCVLLAFGTNLERRTALRRTPMTDLGVFACAASAVLSGENLYTVTEWHGWHYQYPPTLAILFIPLAEPVPEKPPALAPGEKRTEANTPWGFRTPGQRRFYGLHNENVRFFCIVAIWYIISVMLACFAAHALACALEGCNLREHIPMDPERRRRWWMLRTLPLLVCVGSIGTDLSRGQVDILMLAAMAFGLYLAARGREFGAGVWLSVPACVKVFPALLLLYPLWRRKSRMTSGVLAGLIVALAVIPMVAFGPKRTGELYLTWIQVLAKPGIGTGNDTSREKELTSMTSTDNQSLLAFIHNWRYHDLKRARRPSQAAATARHAVYGIGALMLLGICYLSGFLRRDSPRDLLILAGLLMSVALVISPVTHNYYYLLVLPLAAALLERSWEGLKPVAIWNLPLVIWVFMLTDLLARLPTIGGYLRDLGLPLLSLIWLMWAGALALLRKRCLTNENPF